MTQDIPEPPGWDDVLGYAQAWVAHRRTLEEVLGEWADIIDAGHGAAVAMSMRRHAEMLRAQEAWKNAANMALMQSVFGETQP